MSQAVRLLPIIAAAFLVAILVRPGAARPPQAAGVCTPSLPCVSPIVAGTQSSAKAAATSDPIGYGWDLFIYANWRALPGPGNRGVPDPSKPFGESGGPVVWETWKNTSEVYLPKGAVPAPWATAVPVPAEVAKASISAADSGPDSGPDSGDYWQHMTDDAQVDGFNLLDTNDQKILYELLMDRDAFSYIRTNSLYNVQGQMRWASTKGALNFPWNAMEVKASWRWIDPKDTACPAASYFTTKAWYQVKDNNGNPIAIRTGLMGLTGLHIISKALPNWVWITFENVNNAKCTKVKRIIPIDPAVVAANQQMQKALQGTKWANYEMVGVQTSSGTADKPVLLANTQIESAFQTRSSCLTCHSIASVARAKPNDPTVPIRQSFVDTQASPPYFIGPPPSLGIYKSQDFVWSLRKAYWFSSPAARRKQGRGRSTNHNGTPIRGEQL
jgi:hypothetical protein